MTLINIITNISKSNSSFKELRSKIRMSSLEISVQEEIRNFYEGFENEVENYIRTNVSATFSSNYSLKINHIEAATYLFDL